jgi:hypothetical protein
MKSSDGQLVRKEITHSKVADALSSFAFKRQIINYADPISVEVSAFFLAPPLYAFEDAKHLSVSATAAKQCAWHNLERCKASGGLPRTAVFKDGARMSAWKLFNSGLQC